MARGRQLRQNVVVLEKGSGKVAFSLALASEIRNGVRRMTSHTIKLSQTESIVFEPCKAGGTLATVNFEVPFLGKQSKVFNIDPGTAGLIVFALQDIEAGQIAARMVGAQ